MTCNYSINVRDEDNAVRTIPAGAPIHSKLIYPEDQNIMSGSTVVFSEVDNQSLDASGSSSYSVPGSRSTGSMFTYDSHYKAPK